MDIAILVIRLFFGLAMAAHGAQKMFGWFGGHGVKATGGMFDSLGFRPGAAFAIMAGLSELGGGISMAAGLLTPFGAAAVMAAMLVAMVSVHLKNGFFAMGNGIELPFLYAIAALAVSFSGAGAFSGDAWLGIDFSAAPHLSLTLNILAVIGAAATLSVRRRNVPSLSKS